MDKITSFIRKLFCIRWYYLLFGSYVYAEKGSKIEIGQGCRIIRSKIHLRNNSIMIICNNVKIYDTCFALSNGRVEIGESSFLSKGIMPTKQQVIISSGILSFGEFNRIRAQKFWIRFGGKVTFGNYINLNEFSEIRCDESISIGDFVEISYNVKLWDTNTHEIEGALNRRERWKKQYLMRDVSRKPITKPVVIGNDVWIGDSVAILKGSKIGNNCICGYRTLISGKDIPNNTTVLNKTEIIILPQKSEI